MDLTSSKNCLAAGICPDLLGELTTEFKGPTSKGGVRREEQKKRENKERARRGKRDRKRGRRGGDGAGREECM